MSSIFFTSDHHFGHQNILRHCQRPFSSVQEMNEELIRRWNEKVGPDDEVYHLGDFGLTTNSELATILDRLHGTKYLIVGNHEGSALGNKKKFKWVKEYHELKVPDGECPNGVQRIVLFHYALRVWRGDYRGTWQLYGHSHGNLPDKQDALALDVGVDCHNFYPLAYQEVKALMQQKEWQPPFGLRKEELEPQQPTPGL